MTAEEGEMDDIVERLRSNGSYVKWASMDAWHWAPLDDADRHYAADEIERLRAVLESLTKDPPATLAREPDTDAEVIIKMRAIAAAAISHPNQTEPKS